MNKTLIKGMLPAVVALGLTACSAEDSPLGGSTGSIAPEVALDTEVAASARSARSDAELTAEDLVLALTSSDGSYSNSWNGVSAFPTDEKFKTGGYTLTASYGTLENEGFDKPYYFGSTDLTVTENNTTRVSLTAQLANSMISVEYTDNFKGYMQAWSAELHADAGEYIYYAQNETRPAYLRPGATSVNVELTKPNGQTAKLLAANFVTEPRHHYHVTVDLAQGAGDAVLIVKFDDSVDQEDIEIELSDELMNAPAPTVAAQGFDPAAPLTFVAGMAPADLAPKFAIMARGGLAKVTLTTQSKSLVQQGWPESVDLMATPDNLQSRMRALGFDCLGLWKNPDKMAIVDFSAVLNYIGYLESGANESVFTIEVVDRFNKVCEQTVSLAVNVEKLELTLSNPETLMMEDDELALTMDYNGFDAEKNVKFQYYNQRGTWTGLSVKSITPVARSSKSYRVVLTVPADDKDLRVRAVSGSTESAILEVKRTEPPFKLACNENDVFATRALLSVSGDNESPAELAAKAKLLLSTNGGASYSEYTSLTQDGGNLNLSGLEHNTVYTARIEIDGMQSRPITFTTEEKLAIPNGNLDADVTINGSGSHWKNVVFEGWGTNNPMTTWFDDNPALSDFAYDKISGTKQTDDAHNGKAARIRTNGWGSGNSALGSVNCKYIDAGLLHLGSSRTSRPDGFGSVSGPLSTDDLDCGIEFASRPSAVSFWYKYSPKNSEDKGSAKAVVYDASGNIIAEGSLALDKADQYSEISIPLNYSAGSAKAAKIYVCFMSTNNENALKKDKNWLTPPPFGGSGGNAEYHGSTLFIDEVTLNY